MAPPHTQQRRGGGRGNPNRRGGYHQARGGQHTGTHGAQAPTNHYGQMTAPFHGHQQGDMWANPGQGHGGGPVPQQQNFQGGGYFPPAPAPYQSYNGNAPSYANTPGSGNAPGFTSPAAHSQPGPYGGAPGFPTPPAYGNRPGYMGGPPHQAPAPYPAGPGFATPPGSFNAGGYTNPSSFPAPPYTGAPGYNSAPAYAPAPAHAGPTSHGYTNPAPAFPPNTFQNQTVVGGQAQHRGYQGPAPTFAGQGQHLPGSPENQFPTHGYQPSPGMNSSNVGRGGPQMPLGTHNAATQGPAAMSSNAQDSNVVWVHRPDLAPQAQRGKHGNQRGGWRGSSGQSRGGSSFRGRGGSSFQGRGGSASQRRGMSSSQGRGGSASQGTGKELSAIPLPVMHPLPAKPPQVNETPAPRLRTAPADYNGERLIIEASPSPGVSESMDTSAGTSSEYSPAPATSPGAHNNGSPAAPTLLQPQDVVLPPSPSGISVTTANVPSTNLSSTTNVASLQNLHENNNDLEEETAKQGEEGTIDSAQPTIPDIHPQHDELEKSHLPEQEVVAAPEEVTPAEIPTTKPGKSSQSSPARESFIEESKETHTLPTSLPPPPSAPTTMEQSTTSPSSDEATMARPDTTVAAQSGNASSSPRKTEAPIVTPASAAKNPAAAGKASKGRIPLTEREQREALRRDAVEQQVREGRGIPFHPPHADAATTAAGPSSGPTAAMAESFGALLLGTRVPFKPGRGTAQVFMGASEPDEDFEEFAALAARIKKATEARRAPAAAPPAPPSPPSAVMGTPSPEPPSAANWPPAGEGEQ